jgi:hypothetical protein
MQQENVELRRLVQIIEEDRERMRTLMLAMEARQVGGIPSVKIPIPVRYDETHPFWRKLDEEDSYTTATLVEEKLIGEVIGTFSSPVESTDYTLASPIVDREVESNHPEIATFEKHTKGVSMRILSKFGYRKGQGLRKYGQGRAEPIEVHELPLREGLGYAGGYSEDESPVICCTHYQKFKHDVDHYWKRHPKLTPEWFWTWQGKQAARANSDANNEL